MTLVASRVEPLRIGDHTSLFMTLSTVFPARNNLRAEDVAAYALEDDIGLHCYTGMESYVHFFDPIEHYLTRPLSEFAVGGDRNIALLARVSTGHAPEYVKPQSAAGASDELLTRWHFRHRVAFQQLRLDGRRQIGGVGVGDTALDEFGHHPPDLSEPKLNAREARSGF